MHTTLPQFSKETHATQRPTPGLRQITFRLGTRALPLAVLWAMPASHPPPPSPSATSKVLYVLDGNIAAQTNIQRHTETAGLYMRILLYVHTLHQSARARMFLQYGSYALVLEVVVVVV